MKSFKIFAIIVVFVGVAGLGIYFASKSDSNKSEKSEKTEEVVDTSNAKDIGAIFFYGSTCPHCKKVEDYFKTNKVEEKIKVDQKEIYGDKSNATLMQEKLKLCKDLTEDDKGGVPFLYTPDKCILGDQPIIDFFNAEIEKLK
jgi:glutaredoxin